MTIMALMFLPRLRLPQCGVCRLAVVGGSAVGTHCPTACHALQRAILHHALQLTAAVVKRLMPGFLSVLPRPTPLVR